MDLIELCSMLEIQNEVQEKLIDFEKEIDLNAIKQVTEQMKHKESWESGLRDLKNMLAPDEDGLKILTCQLHCVCDVYDEYLKLGISKEIFIDTMKFFTRFLQDYKDRNGSYRYIWSWWAVRQISMVEYRIGVLEYEMRVEDDKNLIDIHIPADADMEISNLRKSYLQSLEFFGKYYPDFSGADMICSSWLLAPSLKNVLPEKSRILEFQKAFDIQDMDKESLGFMDWVYGSRDIPLDELPENTSLQRRLKPYLRNNGKIEWTTGKLVSNPFCEN